MRTILESAALALGRSVVMRSEARGPDDPYVGEWAEAMLPPMLEDARTVIITIREPSEAMIQAAADCESSLVEDVYRAMIDAALSEKA